jgi:hypothetical protein
MVARLIFVNSYDITIGQILQNFPREDAHIHMYFSIIVKKHEMT